LGHARRQLAPTLDLRKPLDASGTVPQRVAARTFCEWGLVNEVVPDDRLTAAVMDLAGRIEGKSQAALARMKAAVEFSLDHSIAEALRHEALALRAHLQSSDARWVGIFPAQGQAGRLSAARGQSLLMLREVATSVDDCQSRRGAPTTQANSGITAYRAP